MAKRKALERHLSFFEQLSLWINSVHIETGFRTSDSKPGHTRPEVDVVASSWMNLAVGTKNHTGFQLPVIGKFPDGL